jgi:hypothetical protein
MRKQTLKKGETNMKKLIPLLLLVLLAAFTAPALAGDGDVQFYAFKTISLAETFTYSETVAFQGTANFLFDGEAWAKVQEQQELYFLHLTETTTEPKTKAALIRNSYIGGAGIANVNQAPGNENNQANETAVSLGQSGSPLQPLAETPETFQGMYCEAQVVTVQYNGILYNPGPDTRTPAGNNYATGGYTKTDTINNSFGEFAGVVNVNQSAGSLNNQGNAVAIAGGIDQIVVKAATNVMLAQNNAHNTMTEGVVNTAGIFVGNNTADTIANGSFAGASGVMNVNQASGSLNNQKNVVSIAFSGPLPQ